MRYDSEKIIRERGITILLTDITLQTSLITGADFMCRFMERYCERGTVQNGIRKELREPSCFGLRTVVELPARCIFCPLPPLIRSLARSFARLPRKLYARRPFSVFELYSTADRPPIIRPFIILTSDWPRFCRHLSDWPVLIDGAQA